MDRGRADVDVDGLLKLVLVLVVLWLGLELLESVLDVAFGLFAFLRPALGLLVLVLILLYLLDRL
jgi:hypothetical protein